MSAPIPLRRDFGASLLRGLAKKTKDGPLKGFSISTSSSIISSRYDRHIAANSDKNAM